MKPQTLQLPATSLGTTQKSLVPEAALDFTTFLLSKTQSAAHESRAVPAALYAIVSQMPGFISVKDFMAEDGEAVAIAEFESLESLDAWKHHPEHVRAQQRGREGIFAGYRIQVCNVLRVTKFAAQAGS